MEVAFGHRPIVWFTVVCAAAAFAAANMLLLMMMMMMMVLKVMVTACFRDLGERCHVWKCSEDDFC